MEYVLTFLEGIITFVSPCLLPMIPVYVMYFSGGDSEPDSKKTAFNALAFIAGFTTLFVALGALAGTVGSFLIKNRNYLEIASGLLILFFGLNYIGLIQIGFLNKERKVRSNVKITGVLSSYLFGLIFSAGWTPCIGTFLSSALTKASAKGSVVEGILMLFIYSMGLGIPLFLSAVLLDKFKSAFDFIKRNYRLINIISGSLLVVYGLYLLITAIFRLV